MSAAGKVCVIIPTFNRAYCLPMALESLQRQSYPKWEALVIDDGSTDGTAALLEKLGSQDPRIRYHYQSNRGVSAARNAGLRLADGDYVGFLDSDDAWEPWKLAAQVACFKAVPEVGMIWTDMSAVDDRGTVLHDRYMRRMYSAYRRYGTRRLFSQERQLSELAADVTREHAALATATVRWGDIYSAMIFGSLVHTSTALLRRERVVTVGFFNEEFRTGEDYDFHLRTCCAGPVGLLDAASIRYRIAGGEDQLTSSRHTLEIARNALRTRETAIAADRKRINLSRAEIDSVLAMANGWVANEFFEVGAYAAARPYYLRSLRLHWCQPKAVMKAALTLLPGATICALLNLRRK